MLFMLFNALFFLKTFKFLSWLLYHAEKTALLKGKVIFKIYDATVGLISKYNTHNTHTPQYIHSKHKQTIKFGQLREYSKRYIFLLHLCRK